MPLFSKIARQPVLLACTVDRSIITGRIPRFPLNQPSSHQVRESSSYPSRSHYEVLGVSRSASVTEIKEVFRKKAKQAHPDTLGEKRQASASLDFPSVLTAYQVLTNARERQLYDLSLDPRTGRVVKDAETAGPAPCDRRESHGSSPDPWLRKNSWIAWAAAAPVSPKTGSEVDRNRAELRTEFRSALRHAYLGPELYLEAGQLPECFEGEERSDVTACDILQLVSGRTLLGVVRATRSTALPGNQRKQVSPSSSATLLPHKQGTSRAEEIQRIGRSTAQTGSLRGRRTSREVPRTTTLELLVGGEVAAFGIQEVWSPQKSRTAFYGADGSASAVEMNGRLQKVGCERSSSGERGAGKQRRLHSVYRTRTSFVTNIHFVGFHGKPLRSSPLTS